VSAVHINSVELIVSAVARRNPASQHGFIESDGRMVHQLCHRQLSPTPLISLGDSPINIFDLSITLPSGSPLLLHYAHIRARIRLVTANLESAAKGL